MITLQDMVKEAQRELALRKQVYPKWVTAARMSEGQATWHLAVMEEIVKTLTRLEIEQRQLSLF